MDSNLISSTGIAGHGSNSPELRTSFSRRIMEFGGPKLVPAIIRSNQVTGSFVSDGKENEERLLNVRDFRHETHNFTDYLPKSFPLTIFIKQRRYSSPFAAIQTWN